MSLNKLFGILTLFLLSSVIMAGVAFAAPVPVAVDNVLINGDEMSVNDVNRLSIEKGEEIEIKVILTALQDADNIQVEAEIKGYEHSDEESTSDVTRVFDAEANVTYRKRLNIQIPNNVDEDDYKLRITVTDRNNEQITLNYNLRIDSPRHSMEIRDIILTPENEVRAGRALLAAVRVRNLGDRDEDSVKIKISIPELGLSASDYIDEVEEGDSETSEELFLRIPNCAEAGSYDVVAEVEYDDGYEEVSKATTINVVENDACYVEEEEEEEPEEEEEDNDASAQFVMDADDTEDAAGNEKARAEMLRNVLEISLIVLIIALVIIGLIVGFAGLSKGRDY